MNKYITDNIFRSNMDRIVKLTKNKSIVPILNDTYYGCGEFGCVYPTKSKKVVFKLTSDDSEYKFVTKAIKLKEWPEGMIQYYQAMKLDNSKFKQANFYGLWREIAENIGTLLETDTDSEFVEILNNCLNIAQDIRENLDNDEYNVSYSIREYINWAKSSSKNEFATVLHAMEWYAKHNIILGDVHLENIGKVKRDGNDIWAITDPGMSVFI